jgi:hypothetical protein
MLDFIQQLVGGIALGCVYGLIALGFVLIYKATEVVNFAQGDLMMLGGFFAFTFIGLLGFNYWIGFACAVAAMALFGIACRKPQERTYTAGSPPACQQSDGCHITPGLRANAAPRRAADRVFAEGVRRPLISPRPRKHCAIRYWGFVGPDSPSRNIFGPCCERHATRRLSRHHEIARIRPASERVNKAF